MNDRFNFAILWTTWILSTGLGYQVLLFYGLDKKPAIQFNLSVKELLNAFWTNMSCPSRHSRSGDQIKLSTGMSQLFLGWLITNHAYYIECHAIIAIQKPYTQKYPHTHWRTQSRRHTHTQAHTYTDLHTFKPGALVVKSTVTDNARVRSSRLT